MNLQIPFFIALSLHCYADGRKTLETYHGRVVENAKSKDIVILDRPLTVTHGHNKGDICGYLISSVSSVPFDVLMTDGREGVIYVKEGETFDLSTNSQYHFDVLPYTCSSGKHLNRKRIIVDVVAPATTIAPFVMKFEVEDGSAINEIGHVTAENSADYVTTCRYVIPTDSSFSVDALGMLRNTSPLRNKEYEIVIQKSECSGSELPQDLLVTIKVVKPAVVNKEEHSDIDKEPTASVSNFEKESIMPVSNVEEEPEVPAPKNVEEEPEVPAPNAAYLDNIGGAEVMQISKDRKSKFGKSGRNRMSSMSTMIIIMVAAAVVGFILVLIVMRLRARKRNLEPEKPEMEWDNSEMKITLNPLDTEPSAMVDEDMFANISDDSESSDESLGDNLSDLNDLDSSDNEDGHKDGLDLEWDNATLTFAEKTEIPA